VTRVALQLWTIRRQCERDLRGTLRELGSLGYDGVELFDLLGHDASTVRGWLDEAGLVACGRHVRLGSDALDVAAEVAVLGTQRAAIAWIEPEQLADPDAAAARIRAAAESARDAGIALGFHNHWSELEPLDGGGTFLDRLRELPADLLWLELDLGWAWIAGADPAAELAATAGRCPLVHLKDYADRESRDDVPVGDGVVGYEGLVPAALAAGAEWLVVEEDEVGDDPFDAVERSLHAVRRFAE
jgi:sugar phosphate isomerase/epimerase